MYKEFYHHNQRRAYSFCSSTTRIVECVMLKWIYLHRKISICFQQWTNNWKIICTVHYIGTRSNPMHHMCSSEFFDLHSLSNTNLQNLARLLTPPPPAASGVTLLNTKCCVRQTMHVPTVALTTSSSDRHSLLTLHVIQQIKVWTKGFSEGDGEISVPLKRCITYKMHLFLGSRRLISKKQNFFCHVAADSKPEVESLLSEILPTYLDSYHLYFLYFSPFLLSLHLQFTVCVSIRTFSLSLSLYLKKKKKEEKK